MNPSTKPFSASCQNNREPILAVIEPLFSNCKHILEIGSGTGQHAVYFAEKMPHLIWHSSDQLENHEGIVQWLDDAGLANVKSPLELDVTQALWPELLVDAVFSANTAHIMSWKSVEMFFARTGALLPPGGLFVLYGPFNYGGRFTSNSNSDFDRWLKERNPRSGIRDFESLYELAEKHDMRLKQDYEMPANNHILIWLKT
ncbi:MAG: DUF938 domain-containing protein [Methylococcales bacterium]